MGPRELRRLTLAVGETQSAIAAGALLSVAVLIAYTLSLIDRGRTDVLRSLALRTDRQWSPPPSHRTGQRRRRDQDNVWEFKRQ